MNRENAMKKIITEGEIDAMIQAHLTSGNETTHSDDCYKWHIRCALWKVIQAYEELNRTNDEKRRNDHELDG